MLCLLLLLLFVIHVYMYFILCAFVVVGSTFRGENQRIYECMNLLGERENLFLGGWLVGDR